MLESKIFLLSKCVERRFAEMLFYDGILHFGYPSEWIKKAEEGNVGQGEQTKPVGREGDYVVYDMSGPLHEMEFVPLMNLLGATYNFRMKCTLNGREAVAYELMEEIYTSDV